MKSGRIGSRTYQTDTNLIKNCKGSNKPHNKPCFIYFVVCSFIMKIKSISEAFSMQPITLSVVDKPTSFDPENSIKEIKLEVMDETTNVYVGYNFDGKKLFEYIAKSVNVHYL